MSRSFDRRTMQQRCPREGGEELTPDPIVFGLRAALCVEPSETVALRHLTAMREAVERPEPYVAAARPRRRSRSRVVWTAVVSSLGLAIPGMAVAGALPGVAQHAASEAAAVVHIDVPDTAPVVKTASRSPRPPAPAVSSPVPASTPPVSTAAARSPVTTAPSPPPPPVVAPLLGSNPDAHPVATPPHAEPTPPPPHRKNGGHQQHHKPKHHKPKHHKPKHHKPKPPGTQPPDPTAPDPPPFGPI